MLGPGGFGITYLARSLRLDRDVAIKEYFPAEFAYREGSSTIRSSQQGAGNFFNQGKRYFVEEARTLGKFRHEHIVRVIGILEENNTAYMVLEFEEGQSFKNWLRGLGRAPTQAELDAVLEPMLSALEAIHAAGIFHRDIAPDNIIMRPNGKPVLIDFGAARQFARENSHTLGAIVKHGYSPPEQYTLDTKLQGSWSDIYALCATMYYAMMGRAPEEASKRQLHDTMLPIEDHMDDGYLEAYHPSFLAGINAGLELRPRDRPGTIAELRRILHQDRDDPAASTTPVRPRPRAAAALQEARAPSQRTGHSGDEQGTDIRRRALTGGQTAPSNRSTGRRSGTERETAPPPDAGVAAPEGGPSEATMRAAGCAAVAVAAIAAVGFLLIGGLEHPGGLVPLLAICAGLCLAVLERGVTLLRPALADVAATAASSAVVAALVLAIYWLPMFLFPLSLLLAGLAAAFAWLRYGPWVPLTLTIVAGLHLVLSLWMLLLAKVEIVAGGGHAANASYFWPLMATSLAVISLLVLISAVQMRRRAAAPAL